MGEKVKFVAFDLETLGDDPEHITGISCAATLVHPNGPLRLWHSLQTLPDGRIADKMDEHDLIDMLLYLRALDDQGVPTVTWNGCSFDFRVLAEQLPERYKSEAEYLCRRHYDPALQMLSEKGFMCGLEAASVAMGARGKMHEMDGLTASKEWATTREKQDIILRYVGQDATTTAETFAAFLNVGYLAWRTKSGGTSMWYPSGRVVRTVAEVIQNGFAGRPGWWSGESYPWTKERMIGWMSEKARQG